MKRLLSSKPTEALAEELEAADASESAEEAEEFGMGGPWVFHKTPSWGRELVKGKACDKFVGIGLAKNSSKID